ncbi:unnamed protein product [Microthlaspi erraticum]|uniref:MADS-box domain-containing protein n=1 Tax=Microthlaspi erraticum TaxID=1685480 RepID=A0A6D2J1H8_9BRAS|nr:unnamed protein product [Microthlaspi erraticum]
MGRRKLEIKRIENKSSRVTTFCKRRNGLMDKARQLSVLCGSSVAVVIFSSTGKLYSLSSGDSMTKILSRYETQRADDLKTFGPKTRNYLTLKELLEIVERKLEEAKRDDISVESLISLEEHFNTSLSKTRARKTELAMEMAKTLQEKEKMLREQNQVLASQLTTIEEKKFVETEDERAPKTLSLLK